MQHIKCLRELSNGEFVLEDAPYYGICYNMAEFTVFNELGAGFRQWPEYSGDTEYPVPSYTDHTPREAYKRTLLDAIKWDASTKYGRSRRRLAGFLADYFEYGNEWARVCSVLRYLLEEGPVNRGPGICWNVSRLLGGDYPCDPYDTCEYLAQGWEHHSGNDAYFIPDLPGNTRWGEEGSALRTSAMQYMLERAQQCMRDNVPLPA